MFPSNTFQRIFLQKRKKYIFSVGFFSLTLTSFILSSSCGFTTSSSGAFWQRGINPHTHSHTCTACLNTHIGTYKPRNTATCEHIHACTKNTSTYTKSHRISLLILRSSPYSPDSRSEETFNPSSSVIHVHCGAAAQLAEWKMSRENNPDIYNVSMQQWKVTQWLDVTNRPGTLEQKARSV